MKIVMLFILIFSNLICILYSTAVSTSLNEDVPKPGKYPALELVKTKKREGFSIRTGSSTSPYIPPKSKLIYFCPGISHEQKEVIEKQEAFRYCLYSINESKAALADVECSYDVEPKLWNFPDNKDKCGVEDQGVLYTYVHEVCWESKSLKGITPRIKAKRDIISKMNRDFIEVYSMCVQRQMEAIYLRYTLVVPTEKEYANTAKDYPLQTGTEGFVELKFEKLPQLFEEEQQKIILKRMFGDYFQELLNPQMLIHPTHIKPILARKSLHTYLNIRPQWSSLQKKWLRVENRISEIGRNTSQNIFIYAGTHGVITVDGKELYLELDNYTKLSVPQIWWKLLINDDKEGIILAMQNVPKGYSHLNVKLCDKSLCASHGWEDISDVVECCEFNKKKRALLNLNAEDIKIRGIFNPKRNRSRIGKWFMKLINRPK